MEQSIHRPSCQALPWTRGALPLDPLSAAVHSRSPTAAHVCDTAPSIGAKRRMESGFAPSKPPRRIGIGYRIPMGEVVVPRPWESEPQPSRARRLGQGKGRWSRASIDPPARALPWTRGGRCPSTPSPLWHSPFADRGSRL